MLRAVWALAIAAVAAGQTPEHFFRAGGADFRGTAPEQRLYWQEHIRNSHRRILQAADLTTEKRVATVLGSGVAIEIPLAELARRFDRLILVDLDGPSMLESLHQVPLELRPKVELRIMDVTSFAFALMERMSDAVDASAGAEEAQRRLGALFDNLARSAPPKLSPSDLVVSSLLLSEIARYPFGYADRLMRRRFNSPLEEWARFDEAFRKLALLAIEDHAAVLASVVPDSGVVYYSDTVARGPAYGRIGPTERAVVEAAVLPEFRGLGLAASAADVGPAILRLCEAERSIKTEIAAFNRLLDAWRKAAKGSFDSLLPANDVQTQLSRHGLSPVGTPESWWWLAYPCAIARNAGAFQVSSWILRRDGAK
jgi:hypothetical protein